MAFDWQADVTPQLTPNLELGESLRAALLVDLTTGTDEVRDAQRRESLRSAISDLAPRAEPPSSTAGRVAGKVGGAILDFASNTSPVKFTFPQIPDPNGVGLSGAPDSQAVWLREVLAAKETHLFAVTDRRIIVLGDPAGAGPRYRATKQGQAPLPYTLLAELPWTQVRSLAHKPKGLARGRVELTFADGSMLALSAYKSKLAQALIEAAPS